MAAESLPIPEGSQQYGRRFSLSPGSCHYLHLASPFRPIPKGLCPPAQGCLLSEVLLTKEGEATLGQPIERTQPHRGCASHGRGTAATPLRFPKVARNANLARISQPWTLRQNPFGIPNRPLGKMWVMMSSGKRAWMRANPGTTPTCGK